jgi:DNA-binding CsgD family transcriptional regulator
MPAETAPAEPGLSDSFSAPSNTDLKRRIEKLTCRELQLIPMVCSGLRNKEIAVQLGIAESTLWHHMTAIFTKLQVEDRLALAALAYRHGLVFPAKQSHQAPTSRAEEPFSSPTLKYPPAADRIDHGDSASTLEEASVA